MIEKIKNKRRTKMLPLIIICVFVLGIGLFIWGVRKDSEEIAFGGIVLAIVFMGSLLVAWPVIYLGSITTIAEMESFYTTNRQNYEMTIEQTSRAIIFLEKESTLQISVENMKQSTNWSERLKELRDEVSIYNNHLYRLTAYNDNLLLDWFFKDIPESFKPIIIELKE